MFSPTLTVEIAFTADLTTNTWTDVTSYVRGIDTVRGRNSELERTGPGTATVVLANGDRRFDPEQGTYANLGPMNRIRIKATYSAVTYDLFNGFVDGWPQEYDRANVDATTTIVCTDAFGFLANVQLNDYLRYFLASRGVYVRYPMNDGPESNTTLILGAGTGPTLDEVIQGADGAYTTSGVALGQLPLSAITEGSTYFDGTGSASVIEPLAGLFRTATTYSISWLMRGTTPVGAGATQAVFAAGSGNTHFDFSVGDEDLNYYFKLSTDGGATTTTYSGGWASFAGNLRHGTHHCMVTRSGTTIKMFVDGVKYQQITVINGTVPQAGKVTIAAQITNHGNTSYVGWLSEFTFFNTEVSESDVASLADLYLTGGDGDTAAERIATLLSQAGWLGTTDLEAGEPRCAGLVSSGSGTALALMQTVDATEQGRLFVAKDGDITLHNRAHNITATRSTTTQCTFSDDAAATAPTGATDVPFFAGGLTAQFDKVSTINSVSVSSPALSASITSTDSTSITKYGTQARSVSTICRNANDATGIAEYIVDKYATPKLRSDAWTVKPERKVVVWPTVLGLEIGDRVVWERTPQGVGSQIQKKLYLERIEHHITLDDWSMVLAGVTAEPEASTNFFTWNGTTSQGWDNGAWFY